MTYSNRNLILIVLAILSVFIRLYGASFVEYHRDELLYFSQATHLEFGYASVPPLTAWLAAITSSIFGTSVWAVKLVPSLFAAGMIFLCARIAKVLGGNTYAQLLAGIGFFSAICMWRVYFLFQPVFLDVTCWSLTFYFLVKILNKPTTAAWWGVGLSLGFGLLSKYLILFLIVGLLIGFMSMPERRLLRSKGFISAVGIVLLLVLPNLIWQYQHSFPLLQHMDALRNKHLVHESGSKFVVEQLLMPFLACTLLVGGIIGLLQSHKYRVLGISTLVVWILLWAASAKPYYALGLFPFVITSGAVYMERLMGNREWLKHIFASLLIISPFLILPIGIPINTPEKLEEFFTTIGEKSVYEDGSKASIPQDYADMYGWNELTNLVSMANKEVENPEATLIFATNYGQAGALKMMGQKQSLPDIVSFHESYLYWFREQTPTAINELIYIDDNRSKVLDELFSEVRLVGVVQSKYAREKGTQVYYCRLPKTDVRQYLLKYAMETTPF